MPAKRHAASTASAPAPSTTSTLSSGPATLKTNSSVFDIASHVWQQYLTNTAQRTLLLDAFMAFLVLVGGLQFVYCVLAGNYVRRPYTQHVQTTLFKPLYNSNLSTSPT